MPDRHAANEDKIENKENHFSVDTRYYANAYRFITRIFVYYCIECQTVIYIVTFAASGTAQHKHRMSINN